LDAYLQSSLGDLIGPSVKEVLRTSQFQYFEEALDRLADMTDRARLTDTCIAFITSNKPRVYQGTRLSAYRVAWVTKR